MQDYFGGQMMSPWNRPLFGLASILNVSFFVAMQFLIPYWLTEGAFGAPIVKSKITDKGLISDFESHRWDVLNRQTRGDEVFQLCRDELKAGCDSQYYLTEPKITKTRPTMSPFGDDIYLNDTTSFEITHWNSSVFEMGVNSRSKLLMNHCLTYVPVSLDPFLFKYEEGSVIYILEWPPDRPSVRVFPNLSLILATTNGPNKFSNESSGDKMAQEEGPLDLTILQGTTAGTDFYPDHPPLKLNPALQRDDGQSFLVVYRAGSAYCPEMVDDPFFSAHNIAAVFPGQESFTTFWADAEATALGCVEQFQLCFPPLKLPQPCVD